MGVILKNRKILSTNNLVIVFSEVFYLHFRKTNVHKLAYFNFRKFNQIIHL